jgi:hypothetical protein
MVFTLAPKLELGHPIMSQALPGNFFTGAKLHFGSQLFAKLSFA